MNDYNISSIIKIMQEGLAETQENAGRMIINPVAQQIDVDVTGKMVTNLVKCKKDVQMDIKNALTRQDVCDKAAEIIKEQVVPKISRVLIDDICVKILNLLRDDKSVPAKTVRRMQKYYDEDQYGEFFAQTILYSLSRNNLSSTQETTQDDILARYRIVQIYPDDLTPDQVIAFEKVEPAPRNLDSLDNQIALCPDCAEEYLHNPTPEEYEKLLQKKKEIVRIHTGRMAAFEMNLEGEIEDIIRAVIGINKETKLKSFTEPVKITEKIHPDFYVLQQEMEDRVVKFYSFIEERFSLFDGVNGVSFNIIRAEVNAVYKKLEAIGLDQEEICDELSNWFLDSFGFGKSHRTAAYIVVSFFIQLCDVFEPFSGTSQENN